MISYLVTTLVSPLGTALFLWAFALFLWTRNQRWSLALGSIGFAWLLVWSTPLASDGLRGVIENQAGQRNLADIPATKVAVVLGGGVRGPRLPLRPFPDLGDAADRVWHAARLYHAGKLEIILLSGGTVRTGDGSEANAMKLFLLDLGVPEQAIELEDASTNTAENARLTASKLKQRNIEKITLITSALHMPRAITLFRHAGLTVNAAPTDHRIIETPFDGTRILPDAVSLAESGSAMKELLGIILAR